MTQNAEHMRSAMQNMILGTPSTPDPFANTPGVSKAVEYEGCIDGGVPNLKARCLFRFSLDRETNTHTNCRDTRLQSPYRTNRRVNCTWNGCPLLDSLILDQAIRKAFLFCEYDQGNICLARCNPRKVRRIDSDVCIRTQNVERRDVWVLRMI